MCFLCAKNSPLLNDAACIFRRGAVETDTLAGGLGGRPELRLLGQEQRLQLCILYHNLEYNKYLTKGTVP
jgi:hypothetical protein